MIVYDQFGNVTESNLSDYDYTLIIDFENLEPSVSEGILNELYRGSTECNNDIILLSNIIINLLDEINYDITKDDYAPLVKLIHKLFGILVKLNINEEKMIIYNNFNKYIKGRPETPISSPSSPVSPPIIKKSKPPCVNKRRSQSSID